jgi:hypothetical protein
MVYKVARSKKTVYSRQVDMIGIAIIRQLPAEVRDRGIGCGANGRRLRTDDQVLAVGLVPHWNHIHTGLAREDACFKLSLSLMRESIAHTD